MCKGFRWYFYLSVTVQWSLGADKAYKSEAIDKLLEEKEIENNICLKETKKMSEKIERNYETQKNLNIKSEQKLNIHLLDKNNDESIHYKVYRTLTE